MKRLLMLALLIGAAPPPGKGPKLSATEIERVRKAGAEILFWNQEQRDRNFRAMETLFPGNVVKAGTHARPLVQGRSMLGALGGVAGVEARMNADNLSGLIVLQDGKIVLEHYARGYSESGRWTSFSVAKSFTSTLVGAAIKDGYIKSVDDPVTRYLPELKGSGYEGVTIRQILTMTSGVRWSEDYTDPKSDVAQMYAKPVPAGIDATTAYLRTLPREAAPGTKWVYKTGETNLIGVLVSRATRKGLAEYLSEKIWKPYGMERDAFWMVDAGGQEIGGCCMSVALKDYARFGQFIMEGGHGVLKPDWLPAATGPLVKNDMRGGYYGYQWWTAPDHFDAMGIFGQSIHIDPKRQLVVAINGAWPTARSEEFEGRRNELIAEIAAAVDASRFSRGALLPNPRSPAPIAAPPRPPPS